MATWTESGGILTLTLEPGDTGLIASTATKTGLVPDRLYTIYLNVTGPVAVGMFLEVVGGSRAVATATSQELVARGNTDGGGVLTYRFGVEHADLAVGASLVISLEGYTSVAAIEADGWVWSETGGGAYTTVSIDSDIKDVGPSSIKMRHAHAAWTSSRGVYSKTFAGYPANAALEGRVRFRADRRPWYGPPVFVVGVTSQGFVDGPWQTNGTWDNLTVRGGNVDGSGDILVEWGMKSAAGVVEDFEYHWDDKIEIDVAGATATEVTFSQLGYCEGSGKGTGGTGTGPEGTDPIPEPPPGGWPDPPTGGARPFMIHDITIAGLGPWNGSVKRATVGATENLIRVAEEKNTYAVLGMGPQSDWIVGGQFSYDRWRAQLDAIYNDIRTRNVLLASGAGATLSAPYTKRRAFCHLVIDEPFHKSRYGQPIPFGTVERMCIYSKTLFPNWTTLIRVDPTDERYTRKMVGLDWMWAEYSTARGPIDSYLTSRLAKAEQLGHGLITGLHYKHWLGPKGPSPRYITPTELALYGGKMARAKLSSGFKSVAMAGWKYESGLWTQPNFPTVAFQVRNEYAAND